MISYGDIDEKGADEPDPAYMHHCSKYRLRNNKSANDGLNNSIRLDEKDLSAVGVNKGDPVRVYAEANGRWVLYERETYNDRPGVGLPSKHREELGLDQENRTVEIWLDEPEKAEPEPESQVNEGTDGTQVSLTGEEADEQEYVMIPGDSPFLYHHISSSDDNETKCGLNFEDQEHHRFTDPGDALDQCSDCAIRSSEEMTNKELVEWLGEQAGFEAEGGTPAYLSKGQLVALRDYILDLQEGQTDESPDENADASTSRRSVIGHS